MVATDSSLALDVRMDSQERLYWKIRYQAAAKTLGRDARALADAERELALFLATYFEAIADYMQTLEMMSVHRDERLRAAFPEAYLTLERVDKDAASSHAAYAQWVRQMYRAAVWQNHPDRAAQMMDMGAQMVRLNAARDAGDVETLIYAAMPAQDQDCATLKARVMELEAWAEALAKKRDTLRASEAYALYVKAFEARLAGRDWLGSVTRKLQQEISLRRREALLEYVQVA